MAKKEQLLTFLWAQMYNDIITKKYTRNKIKMGLARPTHLVIQE